MMPGGKLGFTLFTYNHHQISSTTGGITCNIPNRPWSIYSFRSYQHTLLQALFSACNCAINVPHLFFLWSITVSRIGLRKYHFGNYVTSPRLEDLIAKSPLPTAKGPGSVNNMQAVLGGCQMELYEQSDLSKSKKSTSNTWSPSGIPVLERKVLAGAHLRH